MDADVGIIGAGAAGAILALELARRGIRVVVLESGPRHAFTRRGEHVQRYLRHDNPWETSPRELDRYTIGGSAPYQLRERRVRGLGGSTLHWEGYALRLHPEDFRLRSLHGIADDWPISYDDLEAYYVSAERALGVAGSAEESPSPRSAPFPLPPFAFSHSDASFARACGQLGIGFDHLPQARNSVAYAGRSPCRACSTCAVCPTGAKASTDLTHIPDAEATGNARFVTEATVLRLLVDRSGDVSAAVWAARDRTERRLSARVFVLAAGAVENARLLLLSASPGFANGLANRSGLVGKFFMSHPYLDVSGRAATNVYPYRIGFSTAMSRQFSIGPERRTHAALLVEFLNSSGPTPERIALRSGLSGEALRRHVRDEFGHWLGVRLYCEHLPVRVNSVSLNPRVRDYFGSPAPHIECSLGPYERQGLEAAKSVAARILTTMGLDSIHPGVLSYSGHQIGTHRMGHDPSSSVVDANLRCHDVPNLYLMGSGSFVTASASPPTLTIAALAIRASEHIAARLRPSAARRPAAGGARTAGGVPARSEI